MFKGRSLLALAVLAAACRPFTAPTPMSISSGSRSELRTFIDSMADAPEFSNAHWGILIVDPTRGDTLYSRNAGKLFMPASNMKIPTSATALTQLGPNYRYRTTFAARGTVANGTLDGDLLVIGRGDPSVSDHMFKDAMIPLRLIADSIAARGIKRITGRVLPYGDAFPGDVFGYGWTYSDFEDSYSAPIDELLFNEGFNEAHIRGAAQAGARQRLPRVRARFTFRGSVTTVERQRGGLGSHHFGSLAQGQHDLAEVISGRIGVGDTTTLELTITILISRTSMR